MTSFDSSTHKFNVYAGLSKIGVYHSNGNFSEDHDDKQPGLRDTHLSEKAMRLLTPRNTVVLHSLGGFGPDVKTSEVHKA